MKTLLKIRIVLLATILISGSLMGQLKEITAPNMISEANIYEDADKQFSNAIKYAQENGTSIVLAGKLAYDAKRVPSYYYVEPYKELLKGNPLRKEIIKYFN